MRRRVASFAIAVLVAAVVVPAAGCADSGGGSLAVPSLSQSARPAQNAQGGQANGPGPARASALHAAASCIRQHGIPGYADPVLTSSGAVYSDSRSIQDASQSVIDAVDQACGALLAQANLNPDNEPPAPPQLVQAGVAAAECLRAHGMPGVTDPTSQAPYTPGHGFGMTASEMPSGGKRSPVWQHAAQACRAKLDAELQASTLGSLGYDG